MNKQNGFTLIELMIAVVILGILAAIAVPSYLQYVERTQCEDGKALLSSAAQQMENCRAANQGRYDNTCQLNSSSTIFNVVASGVTATAFTLTASTTPTARISGNLTVNAANTRGGSLAGQCNW